jgi:beta-galactosidase
VQRARPGLYFNRVPSLPATDDGSAKPLAEDLGTSPGSEEDIAWDAGSEAGATKAGVLPGATEAEAESHPVSAADEARASGTDDEPRQADDESGPDREEQAPQGGSSTALPATRAGGTAGEPEATAKRRISRRTVLRASLIGGAGVTTVPLLALVGDIARPGRRPANLTYSVNTNWLFGGQYMAGSESSYYNDSNFASIALPHNVTPLSWQNWEVAAWEQVWIYRRHFGGANLVGGRGPANRIFIDFDGVMVNAAVVINDQAVSTHQGGYLPWSAELTGKVNTGDNLLSVIVDARCLPVPPVGVGCGPGSVDFFQPGGIYRDVTLRVVPQVFLADLFAQPANVLSSQPRVDVECTIDSAAAGHAAGTLHVELLDGDAQIATRTAAINVSSPGTSTAKLTLTDLWPISLWSLDNPKLYNVEATLSFPGLGSHVLTRRIGFREASFRPTGFFLNGERLQLFGLNRHQLYPYAGMAMPARVQRKDAEILKNELNCNMVRCSHYPQSPHFLDACDELGLLVWEEAPGWHNVSTSAAWQDLVVQNVRDMVIRDRSRPSVIIWGTRLNETADFPALWAATRQAAAELDGSRPSSGAMAYHKDIKWNEDVFAFNDYGLNPTTGNAKLKPAFPGLPYLITEAIGVEEARPEHFAWTDSPALLAKQAALHAQAQSQARSEPRISGMLAWAGFDYASILSQDDDNIKWAGVVDGFRVPKPGAAIYQSQTDPADNPVIIPVFFWEPRGIAPAPAPAPAPAAMVASNCERLEVFIDGTHVTTALPALDSPLYSGLAYPPFLVHLPQHRSGTPELLILGYVGGQQVAHIRMSADPAGDTLGMTIDDQTISADGSDATRAVFRAIDAYGNQRRYASGQVELGVSGPATLIGDNPFAFGKYGGLGAVWIRSQAGQPGTITLTASHPLLGQAEVQVRSEQANQVSQLP